MEGAAMDPTMHTQLNEGTVLVCLQYCIHRINEVPEARCLSCSDPLYANDSGFNSDAANVQPLVRWGFLIVFPLSSDRGSSAVRPQTPCHLLYMWLAAS